MSKVFLGGTVNGSVWRDKIIPLLSIDYFNPEVKNWTPGDQEEERQQRESCDHCLYVLTPHMVGTYSVAEVVDDSNKRPNKTVFVFIAQEGIFKFTDGQIKSLQQVAEMVVKNGAKFFTTLRDAAAYLNQN